jgi:hypothetical protein
MAIYFVTSTPKKLLEAFKKAISEGRIATWSCDRDSDFTLTIPDWKDRAWLHSTIVEKQRLVFNILRPQNSNVSTDVYAIYHGRMIEAMSACCKDLFKTGTATSSPEGNDQVV